MDTEIKHYLLEFLPNTVEHIRGIYNLNDGRMDQSLDILEDWIQKQNHFLNKKFSRRCLEVTIISCKGSVEKAKKQIDRLCTYRTLLPKYFICSNVLRTCEISAEIGRVIILPKMTKDYQRVYMLQLNGEAVTSSTFLEHFKLIFVLAEYILNHDYVNGFVFIIDMRDANLMDILTNFNFIALQECLSILTEGYGARIKGIHLITQSKAVDVLVKTAKSFLSEKIANRIYVHAEAEDIHAVVEKEILPIDYGGEERSIEDLEAKWIKLLSSEEHEKHLKVMVASGTDESKRNVDKFNEQYMGMPGSFRTLTVD